MTTRAQMSSIMELIGPELSELSALELENFAIFDNFDSLASANIDQSLPNLATIHMPMRARMSSIMGQIEAEHPQLFALEFGKIAESDFVYLHSSIYKYWPISTKLGQNVYDYKSSDEFYNGTNRTRTVGVVCPWIRKFAIFDNVCLIASANIDQSLPNLATIHMPMRARMSSIMGQIEAEHLELFALEFGKITESDFVYTLASTNIDHSSIHKYWPISTKLGQNVCDH